MIQVIPRHYGEEKSFSFTTPVVEISELQVWNMFSNNGNELGQRFSPYVFAGAGVSYLNIKRDYSKIDTTYFSGNGKIVNGLAIDITHTPPKVAWVLPVGVGMEYILHLHYR